MQLNIVVKNNLYMTGTWTFKFLVKGIYAVQYGIISVLCTAMKMKTDMLTVGSQRQRILMFCTPFESSG